MVRHILMICAATALVGACGTGDVQNAGASPFQAGSSSQPGTGDQPTPVAPRPGTGDGGTVGGTTTGGTTGGVVGQPTPTPTPTPTPAPPQNPNMGGTPTPDPNTVQNPNGTGQDPNGTVQDPNNGTQDPLQSLRFAYFTGQGSPLGLFGNTLRVALSDRSDYCDLLEASMRAHGSAVLDVAVQSAQEITTTTYDSTQTNATLDTYDAKCKRKSTNEQPATITLQTLDDNSTMGQITLKRSTMTITFKAVRCDALLTASPNGGQCI
jgi:hypothetical protein